MRVSVHNIESAALPRLTLRKVRQIPELNERDLARFWAKVERGAPDACWLWTGSGVPNGHGYMGLGHRSHVQPYYAHRIAWTIAHGAIPPGQVVAHRCDRPRCCNVTHLFLGSQGDNVRDASAKGHLNIPRKRNREHQQAAIVRYLAGGVTAKQLGAEFGVSYMTVHRWIKAATNGADQRFRCGNRKGTNHRTGYRKASGF